MWQIVHTRVSSYCGMYCGTFVFVTTNEQLRAIFAARLEAQDEDVDKEFLIRNAN